MIHFRIGDPFPFEAARGYPKATSMLAGSSTPDLVIQMGKMVHFPRRDLDESPSLADT
jgi:hypothetical protein